MTRSRRQILFRRLHHHEALRDGAALFWDPRLKNDQIACYTGRFHKHDQDSRPENITSSGIWKKDGASLLGSSSSDSDTLPEVGELVLQLHPQPLLDLGKHLLLLLRHGANPVRSKNIG